MAEEVQVSVRGAPPLVAIDIRGDVTSLADEAIKGAYRQASGQGATTVLLNFAQATYINSSGVAIVIEILGDARNASQHLAITGLTPHYRKIFDIMGLTKHLQVFDTEVAAREAIASG